MRNSREKEREGEKEKEGKGEMETEPDDPLMRYPFYVKALEFYDRVMEDTDRRIADERWRVIVRQLVRSAGSISANIEEGYGRGTSREFAHRLKIARGEAQESRGWYRRAKKFLPAELIIQRRQEASEIIALLTANINTLERKSGRQS
jgi:four helix bundle protein